MAHVTRYYVDEVLMEVCNRMLDITGCVFSEHRPQGTNDQMNELVVVSLPVGISDRNAYQKSVLRIDLHVRNKTSGISNTRRLGELLDAVVAKFPVVTDRFSATRPALLLKGIDSVGFTVWTLQSKLLINTTDSYVQAVVDGNNNNTKTTT